MTQLGSVIDGKYRVIDKIGEGGMSVVWLVTDSRLNKRWAIKEIKKDARTETHKVIVDSLKAEANLMKGLDHPALPRIVDIIEDGISLYVVMDFIQGQDLLSVMRGRTRVITQDDVINWAIQLCDALSYLHGRGIVYRDMKPGNIMLQDDGTVKIIDFGIAREYSPDKEDDTMPLGTRGYASPEAFKRGVQTTPVSDIYSLGVTLFHLVTGYGPMEFIEQPTLPPIRTINPALSEGLEYVIIKSTQWNPADRYQSCNEMSYDLEHLEDLTEEARKRLNSIMTWFKALAIAAVSCLALGALLLVASNLVRSSSYDDIMERAAVASNDETAEGNASEAEDLYTQAIEVLPSDIDSYSALVNDVYKADSSFSVTEASRWTRLFDAHRDSISGDEAYAKLCYDAGIDYFIYYDYGDELTRGSQAVNWFTYAIEDYDARQERGQSTTLQQSERTAAETYRTIGGFSQLLSQSIAEGTEADAYSEYWDALEQACDGLSDSDAIVVKLRLYNVVFNAIASPNYLGGFRNAGVSETRVEDLLARACDEAQSLQSEAARNTLTANLCNAIVDGRANAETNVNSTYHSVGAEKGNSTSQQSSETAPTGSEVG